MNTISSRPNDAKNLANYNYSRQQTSGTHISDLLESEYRLKKEK